MDNLRIQSKQFLLSPKDLAHQLPISKTALETVKKSRTEINTILQENDERLLVIVGPCSIHDPKAALEYAHLLKEAANHFADELCIIMRVYFEKPRTTIGWKGLISDPFLDESYDMNSGLKLARKLLLDINELGLGSATEFLDVIIPQYLCDLISWSAVGARTSASQIHRELASGLPMPVGFKNSIDGNIKIAIDAVQVASHAHHFLSINEEGLPAIIRTSGNNACHIVLRGSTMGPNFEEHFIQETIKSLHDASLTSRFLVDCSHGNSMKTHQRQHDVVNSLVKQINNHCLAIGGVMLESNLVAGFQELNSAKTLIYGQSITDGCLSWEETRPLLEKLAYAKLKVCHM